MTLGKELQQQAAAQFRNIYLWFYYSVWFKLTNRDRETHFSVSVTIYYAIHSYGARHSVQVG